MAIASPECPCSPPTERGITLVHAFAAPARLVYEAFTQPELVRRWWGASSLTTLCQAEICPGGRFEYASRTFNGGAERLRGTYRTVVPAERLVFTLSDGLDASPVVATVTFFEASGTTQLTSTFRYESQTLRDAALESGVEGRWAERFERLASLLTALL